MCLEYRISCIIVNNLESLWSVYCDIVIGVQRGKLLGWNAPGGKLYWCNCQGYGSALKGI